jgi:hypothetical protein
MMEALETKIVLRVSTGDFTTYGLITAQEYKESINMGTNVLEKLLEKHQEAIVERNIDDQKRR